MRLYFHLVRGQEVIRDEDGIEVADLEPARAMTLRTLEDLRQDSPSAGTDWKGWRLAITDASGAVLLSIDLDEIGH